MLQKTAGTPCTGDVAASMSLSRQLLAVVWAMFCLALPSSVAMATTPEEEALLKAYDEGKRLTARRLAEEILKNNPDSIEGNYVLGCVLFYEEANLAKASVRLEKARDSYERLHPTLNLDSDPWKIYSEILWAIQNLAGQMEEYEYEIETQLYYNDLFNPDLEAEQGWALMKLKRFEEAREVAQRAIESSDGWQNSVGLNTMCALEGEVGRRQESYDACYAALLDEYEDSSPDLTVDANNTSLSAYGILRFDLVEQHAKEATSGSALSSSNPWGNLVGFYLSGGRGAEAVAALKQMHRWRARQPANMRGQSRAGMDSIFAKLLLVAGEADKGMEVITRAIDFPDRRGMTSGHSDQALAGNALIRLAMNKTRIEIDEEAASSAWMPARVCHWLTTWWPDLQMWSDRATVVGVLTRKKRLEPTLRIYVDGAIGTPTWLLGDLISLLGPGVMDAALADIREAEEMPGMGAYYSALEAEIALLRRDSERALRLAESAQNGLPEAEVLVTARVTAIAAEAAWKSGDRQNALSHYAQVMQMDPGTIRRMGLSLPATVVVKAAGNEAVRVGRMLERSPRLWAANGAFVVSVEGSGQVLKTCLRDPFGSQLGCASAPRPQPAEGENPLSEYEYARHVVSRFHKQIFAMPLGLSAHDLHSLDGSTVIEKEVAREQMEALLEDM
ncbi:MAG: hypothetical protein HN348_04895 [Proteobacteria bacterium]|jgi:tetratricopeptide (TPR) repeat protein|nr:hypothetical protein [Pseudomonadota bacterium]